MTSAVEEGRSARGESRSFWALAVLPILVQGIASAFNIWYNVEHLSRLMSAGQREAFFGMVWFYNLSVYTLGTLVWLLILLPLQRATGRLARGQPLDVGSRVALRRRAVNLVWWNVGVVLPGWLLSIPFLLFAIANAGGAVEPRLWLELPISVLISATIGIALGVFSVDYLGQRVLESVVFPEGEVETLGVRPLSLRTRGLLWFAMANVCPVAALLLVAFAATPEEPLDPRFALLVGIFAIGFSMSGGALLERLVIQPVREIRRAARSVGSGQLDTHLDAFRAAEFAPLIEDFNEMVSELRKKAELERRVSKQEERLRHAQRLESVGQLAGEVAHDFNNVLTVISGYAEIVLSRESLDPEVRSAIDEILETGDRATKLTQQLLAFSRRQDLQPATVDPNEAIRRIARLLQNLFPATIEVRTSLAEDAWLIHVDRGQLEQVLMNLAVNARDAMPEGGSLEITTRNLERRLSGEATSASKREMFVRIGVCDTGTGMSDETVRRVFEPFFTTKAEGEGTGLGLAMVYGTVRQSGGDVTVETSPGEGATFWVDLPRSPFGRPDPG